MNKVLVVAVHPDDETLGCGGTLLKHRARGDRLFWLIATEGKEGYGFAKRLIVERRKEIAAAARSYGFEKVFKLKMPAARLDRIPIAKLVSKISYVVNKIKPDIVYFPFKGDVHSDHRIVFEAAYSCIKTFRCPYMKKVLMMETISETEFTPSLEEYAFIPNYFVDISDFLDNKIEIMKIYKSEIGEHPFPRSVKNIKALATFRGAVAGCTAAEGFMLLKEIS